MSVKPVTEVEVRISPSWVNFINWCKVTCPFADISVRIVAGQPTDLLDAKQKIRFDKDTSIPVSFSDSI